MGQTTEELNTEIAGTRESLAQDLDALQDRVSPAAVMQRRKEAMSHRVRSLGSRVMGSAQTASDKIGQAASTEQVRGTASGAAESVTDRVEGSPLAAGLVAFGVGLVAAGLLPVGEAETRASRRAADLAKEHGQPVMDAAKSSIGDVAGGLGDKASEAVSTVKETAQESAGRLKDEATTSAERVRAETT